MAQSFGSLLGQLGDSWSGLFGGGGTALAPNTPQQQQGFPPQQGLMTAQQLNSSQFLTLSSNTTSSTATNTVYIQPNIQTTSGTMSISNLPGGLIPIQQSPQMPFTTPQMPWADPPHGFNRYLNGSDLLEEFIKFCGDQGVKADQFMKLPIEFFLNWLILEAAEADGEEKPEGVVLALPVGRHTNRCQACGRFIARGQDRAWCGQRCAVKPLKQAA